jgi:hypothetical protein
MPTCRQAGDFLIAHLIKNFYMKLTGTEIRFSIINILKFKTQASRFENS